MTIGDLIGELGRSIVSIGAEHKQQEEAALSKVQAAFQRFRETAAATPDALRVGDARVDANLPPPPAPAQP